MIPQVLYIRTTNSCNAKCFMCNFWKLPRTYIQRFQFIEVLDLFKSVKMVRFTGGEPLLCPNLPQFVEICRSRGIFTSIITNGFLLEKKIDTLAEHGLNQVVISIDGSTAELHDKLRGVSGLYSKVVAALNKISTKYPHIHTRVNTVVSAQNIHDLPNLSLWLDKHNVEQWAIIPIKKESYMWPNHISYNSFKDAYEKFQSSIKNCHVELLGYSSEWARNTEKFWLGEEQMRPRQYCYYSQVVAYYNPFEGRIFSCNCLPHRNSNSERESTWYFEHGHEECTGCEPLNAWISDNYNKIGSNILIF